MADNGRGEADGAYDVSEIPPWDEGSHSFDTMENSRAQINVKEKKHGVIESFRGSLKRVGEKSPLSLKYKGSKNKTEIGNTSDSQVHPPPSPNSVVHSGGELPKKREPGRWSFRMGSKKEKTASLTPKQEQLEVVTEDLISAEEMMPEVTGGAVEEKWSYTLPEIPLAPLSVMQINKLIEMEVLEEAYLNLLSLQLEFQRDREAPSEEASSVELSHKEKDLSLLYKALRTKLNDIVRQSCALPSRNKELLVLVACIIQEEEKREGDLGGMGEWREAWRAAVREGLGDTLKGVHLDSHEQSTSWLPVHLGLLGKAIVEDLEKVKTELVSSYPPSFNVFETYVSSCHEVVGEHLKGLLGKVTETKDYYALLDFIIHRYQSEKVMGSISLQPELKEEQRTLTLDRDFLDQIKTGYCSHLQADVRSSLDKIIELEHEEMWKDSRQPDIDEDLYNSHIHMDIWTNIKGKFQATRGLDVNLEQKVMCACLDELNKFPRREHMEGYSESCPQQVELLGKEVDGLIHRLSQALVEHFKTDVKELVSEVHYFVVKEYISQLMKNNYSCKNRKNERAGSKMSEQWGELRELFQEMNSEQNWLYPVGDHLSKIVGQKNKSEIKNNLKPLIDDYPDIGKKHLSAVLYFRGMIRGRERQVILQKLTELKRLPRNAGDMQHALFAEIQPAVNTDCLANMPFSCFSVLIPES
ncbi:exocyst complex component 3-like protein 4 [Colossoma macropomum]|uniref:exocyst complex component 3-like protein 4 n=1 Tax=Colossoma macropomum TaxID=42526 RepID=UPI0018644161|nr:exocyst complex component 3-like protein 4 [Colossoma macropomum]